MQTVGPPSQVPVLLPVGQQGSDRVAALLPDHLRDELRTRHVNDVERAEPGAPDGPVKTLLNSLQNNASVSHEKWKKKVIHALFTQVLQKSARILLPHLLWRLLEPLKLLLLQRVM